MILRRGNPLAQLTQETTKEPDDRWIPSFCMMCNQADLISQFNVPELEPVTKEVEETLTQIMKKAAT